MMKGKINWVQGIGVVLLAFLIVGTLWNFTREEPKDEKKEDSSAQAESETQEGDPYMITLRCNQTTEDPYNELRVGDTLYFFGGEQKMGEIVDLKLEDRELELQDDGRYVLVTDPEEKWIVIKVKVRGALNGDKFMVGENQMNIGQGIYPQTEKSRISANVLRIEKWRKEAEG